VIGTGSVSTVRLRHDPRTGKPFAVKQIYGSFDRYLLIREVENLVKLNHPCVLRILRWALPDEQKDAEIHMEYAENGSLEAVLVEVNSRHPPGFWTQNGIGILISGIVLGMRYVHSRGIVHRDLKPSNILMNGRGYALIADFGVSWVVSDNATPTGGVGTPCYSAPEMWQESVDCTTKCDVFSFGLVLYEILTGKPVFRPKEPLLSVLRRLRTGDLPELPSQYGRFMQELIRKCLAKEPGNRPSFDDIFASFQQERFSILPDADAVPVGDFCTKILEWEKQAGIRI
jgi:serine/threonine-protein kinase ULK4